MARPSQSVPSIAVAGGAARPTMRDIPEETAIALSYNGTTQAVMMATPADLQDFAIGFSLGEGIVTDPSQIERLEIEELDTGIDCQMWLSDEAADRLGDRRRQMAGPVGCGLCGEVSHAAQLCPSFAQIDILQNPTAWDRFSRRISDRLIRLLGGSSEPDGSSAKPPGTVGVPAE